MRLRLRSVLVSAGVGGALLLGAGPAQADPTASEPVPPSVQLQPVESVPSQGGTEAAAADQAVPAETITNASPAGDLSAPEGPDAADGVGLPEPPAAVELEDIGPPAAGEEGSPSTGSVVLEQVPADAEQAPTDMGGPAGDGTAGAGEPGNAAFAPEQPVQARVVIEDEAAGPQLPASGENDAAPGGSSTPAAESIRIGDRLFSPEDFNIPAEVANDPVLMEEWFLDEANLDLLMKSEGMEYLTDLMTGLLLDEDWEGFENLILGMMGGDEKAAAELLDSISWMFAPLDGDEQDTGAGPERDDTGEVEAIPAAVVKPAPEEAPARPAVSAAEHPAPQARHAALAETGARDTAAVAAGGLALVLAGVVMTLWRRRVGQA